MRVYVAAPYEDAELVRRVHGRLVARCMTPTSRWAERASGPDDLSLSPSELETILERNHADVGASDAVLVLARPGAGGEMFVEAGRGIVLGLHVVWCGRRILSSFARGVVRVESLEDALTELVRFADSRDRGWALAIEG